MLWCKHCNKAVFEPQEQVTYDIPDSNVGGYEKIVTYHCPDCGEEVYLEAGKCVMCREYTIPGSNLCIGCYLEIHDNLKVFALLLDLPLENVLDGVAEYLNMEEEGKGVK